MMVLICRRLPANQKMDSLCPLLALLNYDNISHLSRMLAEKIVRYQNK